MLKRFLFVLLHLLKETKCVRKMGLSSKTKMKRCLIFLVFFELVFLLTPIRFNCKINFPCSFQIFFPHSFSIIRKFLSYSFWCVFRFYQKKKEMIDFFGLMVHEVLKLYFWWSKNSRSWFIRALQYLFLVRSLNFWSKFFILNFEAVNVRGIWHPA